MKVGIIGFGYVGQAVYHIISDKNSINVYDINIKKYNEISKVHNSDVIFICLSTPTNHLTHEQEIESFDTFFNYMKENQNYFSNDPLIIIKSTILYKNIEKYTIDFNIVYNPEFLSQNSSFKDSINQKHVILGGSVDLLNRAENFYREKTLIDAEYEYLSIKEAIEFKYLRNIYGAYKVLFWNWVEEMSGNSRKHAELYSKFPQGEMSQVAADGKPGFGGACFQKDLDSWSKEFPHEMTAFMQQFNERIRKSENND